MNLENPGRDTALYKQFPQVKTLFDFHGNPVPLPADEDAKSIVRGSQGRTGLPSLPPPPTKTRKSG